jgi:hypothetical protein
LANGSHGPLHPGLLWISFPWISFPWISFPWISFPWISFPWASRQSLIWAIAVVADQCAGLLYCLIVILNEHEHETKHWTEVLDRVFLTCD